MQPGHDWSDEPSLVFGSLGLAFLADEEVSSTSMAAGLSWASDRGDDPSLLAAADVVRVERRFARAILLLNLYAGWNCVEGFKEEVFMERKRQFIPTAQCIYEMAIMS